uniref:Putative esterase NocK n=1 Tax=Nocardia uniformis subsp. tsuyamanensis TaxID=96045 RepID=NOCK_NOCUT|nr:RecName: Full=Putative esterase NocK; Flags: Precursor [Nocardia uniformis subsp. tsuyamanensis]AAT09798.1 NocK [Nocardia uniformis subsp. tsuyamanensis]
MIGVTRRSGLALAVLVSSAACAGAEPVAPPPAPAPTAPSAVAVERFTPVERRPVADATTTAREVVVAGRTRAYRLHASPGAPALPEGRPLALVLHGKGGSAEEMERHSGLNAAADAAGVALAYLEGVAEGWSASPEPTDLRPDPDADVDFARAVVDELTGAARVDPDHVYAIGFSEGGMMALRLAAEHPDWFAGVASVAGQLPSPPAEVRPTGPIPVLSIYGDADPLRPFDGLSTAPADTPAIGKEPPKPTISTAETVEAFCRAGGADERRREEARPAAAPGGTSTSRETCANPDSGLRVVSITVHGGGHTWPGGTFPYRPAVVGATDRQLSTADTAVDFLLGG